jgi:predicted ferric reductase
LAAARRELVVNDQLWWYLARSGGVAAWAMLAFSVLWGLALSTKVFGGKPRPNWILDLHRFTGGAAVVFTGIHVVSLVLDSYVEFGVREILVPFTSSYRPSAVAWGVIAFYLLLAVEITSLLRKRLSKRAWRVTHFLSFPLFILATAHGVTAGTDKDTFLLRAAFIGVASAVGGLTAIRATQADIQRAPSAL